MDVVTSPDLGVVPAGDGIALQTESSSTGQDNTSHIDTGNSTTLVTPAPVVAEDLDFLSGPWGNSAVAPHDEGIAASGATGLQTLDVSSNADSLASADNTAVSPGSPMRLDTDNGLQERALLPPTKSVPSPAALFMATRVFQAPTSQPVLDLQRDSSPSPAGYSRWPRNNDTIIWVPHTIPDGPEDKEGEAPWGHYFPIDRAYAYQDVIKQSLVRDALANSASFGASSALAPQAPQAFGLSGTVSVMGWNVNINHTSSSSLANWNGSMDPSSNPARVPRPAHHNGIDTRGEASGTGYNTFTRGSSNALGLSNVPPASFVPTARLLAPTSSSSIVGGSAYPTSNRIRNNNLDAY